MKKCYYGWWFKDTVVYHDGYERYVNDVLKDYFKSDLYKVISTSVDFAVFCIDDEYIFAVKKVYPLDKDEGEILTEMKDKSRVMLWCFPDLKERLEEFTPRLVVIQDADEDEE